MKTIHRSHPISFLTSLLLALLVGPGAANAFCGFFVAKAETRLFNRASQVVLARDGDRTVITMANDYEGDPAEFAMVIPVPTFIQREQINVAEPGLLAHLDAYSAPRLVEYHDPDPCAPVYPMAEGLRRMPMAASAPTDARSDADALGVTIEAEYTVGEYDILILSAEQSDGLVTWLNRNGYRMPEGAEEVVGSYLAQGMRFFVARVNLGEQRALGVQKLRPIQVAYESPKFMLPIRLGTVNADGPQELFIYTLTRRGRVEPTNYRLVKLPSDVEIPTFVRDEFGDFYRDLFGKVVAREEMRAVFLEYAWDMSWCDPCAADPLSVDQLRSLGAGWQRSGAKTRSGARDVFLTRLHLRYDREHFPEDLRFQETSDRQNFQGRYVMRNAFQGEMRCAAAEEYLRSLAERRDREARNLADLTGWSMAAIREKMSLPEPQAGAEEAWWKQLWR